ncbi:MAG: ABC transporter ATP-binding protein [Deltaproteobacteria bacterium]|nr:ABC transporter ATP-binding protein [Deltaproteobacteria bacterium]
MPDPIVQVIDLVASYGERRVLEGVSFHIPRGEITVIAGSSGCGKTTLLRHMVGLLKPESGRILVRGEDIVAMSENELNRVRTRQGVLFQGGGLLNSMTLADNVALPLREHTSLEESTIRIMTRMKLELVGLLGFDGFLPSQISGGMKKRAGLARAISMDPEILYFDEPTAGLDPGTSAEMDELILKLKKTFRMTIVAVTHELPSIKTIADRVIMLDQGRVIFCGTLQEILASADPTVRRFLDRKPVHGVYDSESYLDAIAGVDI